MSDRLPAVSAYLRLAIPVRTPLNKGLELTTDAWTDTVATERMARTRSDRGRQEFVRGQALRRLSPQVLSGCGFIAASSGSTGATSCSDRYGLGSLVRG